MTRLTWAQLNLTQLAKTAKTELNITQRNRIYQNSTERNPLQLNVAAKTQLTITDRTRPQHDCQTKLYNYLSKKAFIGSITSDNSSSNSYLF